MDPRVKVEGVENILNFIANWMNQPSQPKGKEYKHLNISYKYYETKYGSVSLCAITPCAFGNDPLFM